MLTRMAPAPGEPDCESAVALLIMLAGSVTLEPRMETIAPAQRRAVVRWNQLL